MFDNEKCFFTCVYRSLGQINKQLDSFGSDFNNLLIKADQYVQLFVVTLMLNIPNGIQEIRIIQLL